MQIPPKEKTMQELSEQQIERANAELAAMTDGWILGAEGWRGIAPHLQYAPAPVDGDAALKAEQTIAALNHEIDLRIEQGKGLNEDKDLFRAELAEYKKALGPLSPEEKKARQCYGINASNFDSVMTSRRALLEKKPDPIDPLHGLTSKYMPETTKAVGLSLHDELIAEAFNRGRSEPKP